MTLPQRPLGSTGLRVSVLGYGGAPIGFAGPERESTFVPLLQWALDLGITFFDTAPDYRRSEELLGAALVGRRAGVVLATKCGRVQHWNGVSWDGQEDWSEAGVVEQIETSLRRLRTDYLDLVQLHSPPRAVLEDGGALRGLLRAQAAGKVRYLGVSADGAEAWQALALGIFATLQVSYSILQQEPGTDLLAAAAAQGMGVIVKQPVANGIPALPERPGHPDWAAKWDIAQRLDWPARSAPADRMDLALRWVLADPRVSTAIVGTTRREHLGVNVATASGPPLDAATRLQIREAYQTAQAALTAERSA
jgi:aryl-alcohol dehydrogenase-like predicted oxidoreductase